MKLEEEAKKLVDKYILPRFDASNFLYRGKMTADIVKLVEKREKDAYDKGYEAGRWDRPTNKSGS